MYNWNEYYLQIANIVSQRSKDPDRKVGCVIVGENHEIRSTGYNGLVRGIQDLPERLERPGKYKWMIHAELNAILNAAFIGVSLKRCTLYSTTFPCFGCTKAIAQTGIKSIITLKDLAEGYKEEFDSTIQILKEASIELIRL